MPVRPSVILDHITDALVVADKNWRIVYANPHGCEVNQKSLHALLGKSQEEEWTVSMDAAVKSEYRRAMDDGVDRHLEHHDAGGGQDVWLEIDAYPSKHGLHIFYRDITDRKKTLDTLRSSHEHLQLAVDGAKIGTFYCDWPLDKIMWNETCKTHFFLPPDVEVDFDLFYALLHPFRA